MSELVKSYRMLKINFAVEICAYVGGRSVQHRVGGDRELSLKPSEVFVKVLISYRQA